MGGPFGIKDLSRSNARPFSAESGRSVECGELLALLARQSSLCTEPT